MTSTLNAISCAFQENFVSTSVSFISNRYAPCLTLHALAAGSGFKATMRRRLIILSQSWMVVNLVKTLLRGIRKVLVCTLGKLGPASEWCDVVVMRRK